MKRPSITVPDELLEDFDQAIIRRKAMEAEDSDVDRSEVMRRFMREYVEETEEMWGNTQEAMTATAD